MLDSFRFHEAEVDELGYVLPGSQEGYVHIVDRLPCNAYRYDGRPEDVTVSGTPGQTVNALTIFTAQYNEKTALIHVDDEFDWGNETYYIVDINRVGVNIFGEYGTLKFHARKKPGGLHGY